MDFAKQYKWVLVILFALVLLGVYVHFHNKNKLKKERAPGKQPAAKKTSQVTTNVANPPVTDSHRENPAQRIGVPPSLRMATGCNCPRSKMSFMSH